jgi:hypothetical protein
MWVSYDSVYEVSDQGEVRNKNTKRILKPYTTEVRPEREGYLVVKICNKNIRIHRIVALCFLPRIIRDKDEVDHINRDILDNRACNLQWCDAKTNGLNKGMYKNNTSGHKYIHHRKDSNKYRVIILRLGICKQFDTLEEASAFVLTL